MNDKPIENIVSDIAATASRLNQLISHAAKMDIIVDLEILDVTTIDAKFLQHKLAVTCTGHIDMPDIKQGGD